MEDKRKILQNEKPFSYKIVDSHKAFIFFNSKMIYTAVKKDYLKLIRAVENGDDYLLQLTMAKMTGNFKHGNEK